MSPNMETKNRLMTVFLKIIIVKYKNKQNETVN